ncbi:MAG: putative transposase [Arenicella sp.]
MPLEGKKGECLLCERNEVKYHFIRSESTDYPVTMLCRVMRVCRSSYYNWLKRPSKRISAESLHLHRRMKELFINSRHSLGSREMMKNLCKEGISIGRFKVRRLMKELNLVVTQRVAYKVTTKRKHSDSVADDLLNRNFNPTGPNQVWAGDITYLGTGEGWMYLAVVMDLKWFCTYARITSSFALRFCFGCTSQPSTKLLRHPCTSVYRCLRSDYSCNYQSYP